MLKEYSEDIVRVGVDEVVVSIDTVEDDTYSRFRMGSVSDVIMGLYELYRVRKKYNSPLILGLAFTVTTLNYSELPGIVKLANSVKAVYINLSNIIPVSEEMIQYACFMSENCRKEIKRYLNMVSRLALEYPIRIYKVNFTLKAQRTCSFMAENALFMGWDGKLSPCLHYGHNYYTYLFSLKRRIYRIVFGDINRENLMSVWFKRDYHLFRYIAKTGYLPSCLDCDIAGYCVITKDNMMDCWGNSPTCAHCPFMYGLTACPL